MQNSTAQPPKKQESHLGALRPNTTQTPNELYDRIMPVVTPATWKVICFICRKTYGWRKDWDALSLTQISSGTGLSDTCVSEALAELIASGLLKRGSMTNYGFLYSLNVDCDLAAAVEIFRPKPRKVYDASKRKKKTNSPPIKLEGPTKLGANSIGDEGPTKLGTAPQLGWDTKETLKTNSQNGDCAQGALLPLPPELGKSAEPKDPREAGIFAAIRKTWAAGTVCDIDNRDAKAIREYLKRKPAFPGAELELCIVFRSFSEGENLTLPVRKWISDVDKYQAGPLNKFGDPLYSAKEIPGLRSDARTILYGPQPEQLTLKAVNVAGDGAFAPMKLPPDFNTDGKLWLSVLGKLETKISRHSYDTWLKPTRTFGLWRSVLYVQIPNKGFSQIGITYGDLIQEALDALAPECKDVKFLTLAELRSHSQWMFRPDKETA